MGEGTMQEIYDRLRLVEKDTALAGQKLVQVEENLSRVETEKIDPMRDQVNDLHTSMNKQKGFWGGIFLMAGALWTIILAAAAAVWRVLSGGP